MTLWLLIPAVALANFGFIFLKAFQQRNVAFEHYEWILPISLALAAFEVFVIAVIAKTALTGTLIHTLILVLSVGIGGGLGAIAATHLHSKHLTRKSKS